MNRISTVYIILAVTSLVFGIGLSFIPQSKSTAGCDLKLETKGDATIVYTLPSRTSTQFVSFAPKQAGTIQVPSVTEVSMGLGQSKQLREVLGVQFESIGGQLLPVSYTYEKETPSGGISMASTTCAVPKSNVNTAAAGN
jgi:hypothetical protein